MFARLYYQKKVILVFTALLLCYTICRFIFFVFNPSFFQFDTSYLLKAFLVGLLFDTSAIIYTNSLLFALLLIPSKIRTFKGFNLFAKWYFYIVNAVSLFLNLMDTEYYKFSGKRSGIEIFSLSNDLENAWLSYVKDYWYVVLMLFTLIYLLVYLFKQINKILTPIKWVFDLKQFGTEILSLIIFAALAFVGARGGFNLTPINTFDAARMNIPQLVPLVVNTPFQFIMSSQQVGLKEKKYFSDAIALKYYNPIQKITDKATLSTSPNIVVLILESLGKEYVGYFNNGKGYTPFIDSLMRKSMVYSHAYANGKRSIEGIPAIISSLPTWMDNDYPSSYYQSNLLNSIGAYLSSVKYNASFYHGGKNGTMSFNNFVAITGGGKYYGLNEYPDQKHNDKNWGIYDDHYLQYFANELNKKPNPFYASLFTLSSHHPYAIPDALKNKFAEGTLPIHKSVRYTDYALQQFFKNAKKQAWFKNTIFIITADHSAENETPYYQTEQGKFEIPLFVYSANTDLVKPKIIYETVQQIDIMPMVLSLIKYNKPFYSIGTNNNWAMQYTNGFYQLIIWPYVYQFDGKKALGFYDLLQDKFMLKNELKNPNFETKIKQIDTLTKSVIQRYNHDLINNKTHLNY